MADQTVGFSNVYDAETVRDLEKEFTRLKDTCYLDHAGATLYSKTQIEKFSDDLNSTVYGNPHSLGTASKLTLDMVDQMRFRILDHFHTTSDEYSVIFTASATDSLKLVSESFIFDQDGENGHFVHLQDNHTSVLGMREVVARRGAKVTCLPHERAFEVFQTQREVTVENSWRNSKSNSLFVYPAQCNFSGLKYPLSWIKQVRDDQTLEPIVGEPQSQWFTLLDAAGFVATNDLDLAEYTPDFVCLSFYKMFGYPTGVGALLVRNSSAKVLRKTYYGGGTVEISLSSDMFHSKRPVLHERFEDGTLPFLSIISLRHGFEALSRIPLSMISRHVFSLAKHLHDSLLGLHHGNGAPIANLYGDTDYEDEQWQGGTVTFNLMRSNGENIGFVEFLNMANLHKIHVRTGCFCNPGACQRHLRLSNEDLRQHFNVGHVCGDERDLINGQPTGAVRVSFGYMSRMSDVNELLNMIKLCFLRGPEFVKIPEWWEERRVKLRGKYCDSNAGLVKGSCNGGREEKLVQRSWQNLNIKENERVFVRARKLYNSTVKENQLKLKRLFIYPVKSCAGYEVPDTCTIGDKGLTYDREWMITTASGVCLTQKQEVKMCLIKPTIRHAENLLELNYPGMPSMKIPLKISPDYPTTGTICRSKICGHKVEGIDCGTDVSEWLSLSLGRPGLRLVKQSSEAKTSPVHKTPELSFSSQAQYLLINAASIEWLAEKVPANSDCSKDSILNRFRGNIVVEGCEAFEEMTWKSVRIGKTKFQVDSVCTRCQMICIDQNTGEKTVEPLRTLAEEFHGKLRFGVYLSKAISGTGIMKIGDEVTYQ